MLFSYSIENGPLLYTKLHLDTRGNSLCLEFQNVFHERRLRVSAFHAWPSPSAYVQRVAFFLVNIVPLAEFSSSHWKEITGEYSQSHLHRTSDCNICDTCSYTHKDCNVTVTHTLHMVHPRHPHINKYINERKVMPTKSVMTSSVELVSIRSHQKGHLFILCRGHSHSNCQIRPHLDLIGHLRAGSFK